MSFSGRLSFVFVLACVGLGLGAGCSSPSSTVPIITPPSAPAPSEPVPVGVGGPTAAATVAPSPSANATAAATAASGSSTTFTIATTGGSQLLDGAGYGATFVYPGNASNGSVTGTLTVATQDPAGTPPQSQPAGAPLAYYAFTITGSTSFQGTIGVSTFTLPSAPSGPVAETLYDQTSGVDLGSVSGVVNGSTVTFGSVEAQQSFNLLSSDAYVFEITET